MTLLSASGISVWFGQRELFSEVAFDVGDKDKIGLIGANGTGKTTLFQLLIGKRAPDKGGFAFASGTAVGYMEQYLPTGESRTAYEEALTIWEPLTALESELEQISVLLEQSPTEDLIHRQFELQQRFERMGGLTYQSRTRAALLGLGFLENELGLPVSSLSGGQRSKISLAKLLLSDASLLLLDEPTNHLDIHAVRWLEEFLAARAGACIIISHDRYFLDQVTNRTFEIEHCRLRTGSGSYTAYIRQKEIDREIQQKHYETQLREIKRVEGIIEQYRRFNREKSIRQAESREKQLEKLKAELGPPPKTARAMRFSFQTAFDGPTEVLRVEGLSKSYDRVLYKDVNFDLFKQERAFLIGKNGCGKTTLLRQILEFPKGVVRGAGVKIGYYEQGQESLNPQNTALDEVWNAHRQLSETEVRSALAAFLFRGDEVYKKVGVLSGGERARIAILKLMLSRCNLLLLDEPTNHLDINAREALEQALLSYGGTLLVVSHDRYFINRLSTKILELTPEGVIPFEGDYDGYLASRAETEPRQQKAKTPGRGGRDWAQRKEQKAALRRLKSRLQKIEEEIRQTESCMAQIEALLSSGEITDYEEILRLTKQAEDLNQSDTRLLEEWEQVSEELMQYEDEEEPAVSE